MKKFIAFLIIALTGTMSLSAQSLKDYFNSGKSVSLYTETDHKASITFYNRSDYTMTLKIMKIYGGLYSYVILSPHSSRVVTFGSTNTYRLKIKAEHNGNVSYHDGDTFSVTCNDYEWSEGSMEFRMATYGSGLGPKISRSEFESNE